MTRSTVNAYIQISVSYTHLDVYKRQVYGNLNSMEGQINTNKNKIEEINRRELQLQEEVDSWRDRTCQNSHTNNHENRESINFRNYKRNPCLLYTSRCV